MKIIIKRIDPSKKENTKNWFAKIEGRPDFVSYCNSPAEAFGLLIMHSDILDKLGVTVTIEDL